jgi:hypothetical protein
MAAVLDILLGLMAVGAVVYAWFLFFVYPRMSEFREMQDAAERLKRMQRIANPATSLRPEPREILAISEGLRAPNPSNGHAGV